jgi:hypothetical protein
MLLGALAALLLVVVLVFALSGSDKTASAPSPPPQGGSILQEPPKASMPVYMRPQPPLNRAREAAEGVDDKNEEIENVYRETKDGE